MCSCAVCRVSCVRRGPRATRPAVCVSLPGRVSRHGRERDSACIGGVPAPRCLVAATCPCSVQGTSSRKTVTSGSVPVERSVTRHASDPTQSCGVLVLRSTLGVSGAPVASLPRPSPTHCSTSKVPNWRPAVDREQTSWRTLPKATFSWPRKRAINHLQCASSGMRTAFVLPRRRLPPTQG